MDIKLIHSLFLKCDGIAIDTRKIKKNSFFVAIKGERYDANTFAKEALEKGASFVIIDNPNFFIDERTIIVEDSLVALQELAKYHRTFLNLPIVALTGSNGKTTTKELIHCILAKKYNTKATVGNLNNHIGVPLTLLSFTSETEMGIVEMGANHQKEIEFLCEIAKPDFGYITNFGKAHLEGFGGIEGVIKGKSEMYNYLQQNDKTAFVNLDDPIQKEKSVTLKTVSFASNSKAANVFIDTVKANPFVVVEYQNNKIVSHLIGLYNANNINAAITIGKYFNVSDTAIKQALESYIPENNRSQLLHLNSNEIILDAYNANPSSMEVAIDNFIKLDKSNKMVILGDMFELGTESLQEHKNIVNLLLKQDAIECYFVGKDFYSNNIIQNNFHFFETFERFSEDFKNEKIHDKMMLIKGSRGMALERTLELIS